MTYHQPTYLFRDCLLYTSVLYRQHEQIRQRSYPVIKSNPEKAIEDLYRYIEEQDAVFDVVLFDLPGTLRSEGVVIPFPQ